MGCVNQFCQQSDQHCLLLVLLWVLWMDKVQDRLYPPVISSQLVIEVHQLLLQDGARLLFDTRIAPLLTVIGQQSPRRPSHIII